MNDNTSQPETNDDPFAPSEPEYEGSSRGPDVVFPAYVVDPNDWRNHHRHQRAMIRWAQLAADREGLGEGGEA